MLDLSVKYMGLHLKNPIIAGSCGLTQSFDDLQKLENSGVAAITLKSLFEEQIHLDAAYNAQNKYDLCSDVLQNLGATDLIEHRVRRNYLSNCIETIREAKEKLTIPIIASINCITASGWTSFASKLQEAGADAIELNIAIQLFDPILSSEAVEDLHLEIIEQVRASVSIPISVKLCPYFASISQTIKRISESGIDGMVLFNRLLSSDIDIDKMKPVIDCKLSTSDELPNTLRWIALKSGTVPCDLCASTGIHSGSDVIKILLAGGVAAQVVSTLYKNGLGQVSKMLDEIETWMTAKGFSSIEHFAGMLQYSKVYNQAPYERLQFMKYYFP